MQLVASQEEEGLGAGWWEGRKRENSTCTHPGKVM